VNLAGEVIGINTLVVRNAGFGTVAEGLGFAVLVSTARAVAEQIIAKGYFSRPYMGIRRQLITPDVARTYDLPVDWAVYVTDVVAGSQPGRPAPRRPGARRGHKRGTNDAGAGHPGRDEHEIDLSLTQYEALLKKTETFIHC
jgi:2-alkenal reductase